MGGNLSVIEVFAGPVREYVTFDVSAKLHDLRNVLVKERYISVDDDKQAWRFVSPTVDNLDGDLSEAIAGIDASENFITVKEFLYGGNKVRMVNIKRAKPDLIGVGVDYLSAGDIEVKVSLNCNITPAKFQPVMMTNVRLANKDENKSNFSNVVLCEKETAIGFEISSKKHKGFAFSITPREGEPIIEWAYATSSSVRLSMYGKTGNAIEIVSFKDLNIPTQQSVGHRRLTVTAWRLISYKQDGKSYQVDSEASSMNVSVGSGVDVVPGDGIEGGAFKEGPHTNGVLRNVYDVVVDEHDVLGTVEIDFFVFKTREDAQRMIESRY